MCVCKCPLRLFFSTTPQRLWQPENKAHKKQESQINNRGGGILRVELRRCLTFNLRLNRWRWTFRTWFFEAGSYTRTSAPLLVRDFYKSSLQSPTCVHGPVFTIILNITLSVGIKLRCAAYPVRHKEWNNSPGSRVNCQRNACFA